MRRFLIHEFARFRRALVAAGGDQIDQREDKHPDEIDKVPLQAADFDVVSVVFPATESNGHKGEVDDADCYVRHVQTRETEETRAENRRSPGI